MRLPLFRSVRDLPFTPGDWFVMAVLGALFCVSVFWFLTAVSMNFTVEIPTRGGSYHEAIIGTPRFINPVLALSDADRDLVALTFAGLMRSLPDGSLVPDIAESYTLSEDERTYTFTIREGAVFHDGTPITAEDVVFTVSLATHPTLKSPKRANWEGIAVAVVDERTVSFTLKEPYALFLENARVGILPRHLWADVSVEEMPFSRLNIEPIGAGPYSLQELVTTSAGIPTQIILESFEHYSQEPYIETLELTFVSDADALMALMNENSLMGAHTLVPSAFPNRAVHEAVMGRVFSVFFNQNQNDLFADTAVREALDTVLDKNDLVATLISGYGSPSEGPLPPESVTNDESSISPEERVALARQVLEDGGWKLGDDGVYAKTEKKVTKRLSFTLSTGNAPELKAAGETVAATWTKLGVEVSTQFFDANDLQQNVIRPRKYDALLFGEVVGRDADLFAFWDSSQRNDPGLNIALYTNTAVDKLLREARTEPDAQNRAALIREAAGTISEERAAVFLYSPHFLYLTPTNLSGIELGTIVTPADRYLSVTNWYQETERVWPILQ